MHSSLLPVIAGLASGILTIVIFSAMSPVTSTTIPVGADGCNAEIKPNKTYAIVYLLNAGPLHSREPLYEELDSVFLAEHPEILKAVDRADFCSKAQNVPAYVFALSKEQAIKLVIDPGFHFDRFTGELADRYYYSNFTYKASPYRLYVGFDEDVFRVMPILQK